MTDAERIEQAVELLQECQKTDRESRYAGTGAAVYGVQTINELLRILTE